MKKRTKRNKLKVSPQSTQNLTKKSLGFGLDEKYRDLFHVLVLLAFGTFLAVWYFGHQTVPNSDFVAFFKTGEQVLSGHLPSSFKRLPGLGVLQVLISYCVPSSCNVHPSLMAGWILNLMMYAGIGVCLYKLARQVLGSSAVWYCLLVLINPMMLLWMQHPVVETSFIFFIILTFIFIMKGSRWAYVFAVITCLFRYEGAFLIPVCFFMDFFSSITVRQKVLSFVRAGLSAVPLTIWMLLSVRNREQGTSIGQMDYVRNYKLTQKTVIGKFSHYLWDSSVGSLTFFPDPSVQGVIITISKILLVVGLLAAVAYAIYKKQWKPLGLLGFFVLFCVMHAIRNYTLPRYGFPAIWVTVLLVWYGFQSIWKFCDERKWIPEMVKYTVPIVMIIISLWWGIYLRTQQVSERQFQYQVQGQFWSERSACIHGVTLCVVLFILIGGFLLFRKSRSVNFKKILSVFALISVMFFAVTSNQFDLSRKVGNGAMDQEFKMLADWYRENAMGEKMACTMSHVMRLYLPDDKNVKLCSPSTIPGDTPDEFIKNCIQEQINYVAWDSRIGFSPPDSKYYKLWKMKRMAFLVKPQDWGPLKFEAKIQNKYDQRRFIHIYKVQLPIQPQGTAGE